MIAFLKKYKLTFAKVGAAVLAILIWQIAAVAIGESLILPSPVAVFRRLFTIWREDTFFPAVFFSISRILLGFIAALTIGTLLAIPAGKYRFLEILLSPYMLTIKSVPVASFIVLAYVWFSASSLSAFISFLIVLPAVYTNILTAMHNYDPKMKETAKLFGITGLRKLLFFHLPQIRPYFLSAASLAMGLAWKSGIAAEIITMPKGSMGNLVYYANLWLVTEDLYAYTVVIVLLSLVCEKAVGFLLRKTFDGLGGFSPVSARKEKSAAEPRDIVLVGIGKSYGEHTVLADLTATFPRGKATCIMAPSGVGKTTLLRLIAGFERPDGGSIAGADGGISAVFQENRLSDRANAVQNAMLGRPDATREEAKEILTALGLGEHLKKPVSSLSGGMRRRVAIARALLSDAPLLLFDEAFKGLDEQTKKQTVKVVLEKTRGKTLLAVTHDENEAALLGADVFHLALPSNAPRE